MNALRAQRAASHAPHAHAELVEEIEPLTARIDGFWVLGAALDDFRVNVAQPQVSLALIKRLGAPPFWRGPHDFIEVMREVYEAASAAALDAA